MQSHSIVGDDALLVNRHTLGNRQPSQLRLRPNVAVDAEPVCIVKAARCNGFQALSSLGCVRDGRCAFRAKNHSQPTPAFVRSMLASRQLALQNFDRTF